MLEKQELLKRITHSPEILGGKAIIRGHRMSVEMVLSFLAAGESMKSLLEHYDYLEPADISACLLYAADIAGRETFHLRQDVAAGKEKDAASRRAS